LTEKAKYAILILQEAIMPMTAGEVRSVLPKPVKQTANGITPIGGNETHYKALSKKDALAMTSEVIKKYRPALEELAK
jgi:hypothetical protein